MEVNNYDQDDIKIFRDTAYGTLKWTYEENLYRKERKYMEKIFPTYTFSFTSAIILKLRKSIFGKYLDIFNLPQNQDKFLNENKFGITQWDVKHMDPKESKYFEKCNKIIEDYFTALKNAVETCEVISLDYIYSIINLIDGGLRKFANVQILTLTGNNLKNLKGSSLPRRLLILELYDNFISNLQELINGAPNTLIHLGLGRNKLNDDSSHHLLSESNNFMRLRSLDLSDNDIYNLDAVVSKFVKLYCLRSFVLEGNPCSVVTLYKDIVFYYLPKLLFLDHVEILKKDRNITDNFQEGDKISKIIFMCHRIMGLPKPPKEKKAKQFIHLEVMLPLLETVHFSEPIKSVSVKKVKSEVESDKKNKDKSRGSEKTSKKSAKNKTKSPYARPSEYDPVDEKNNFSFKTERTLWNKMINFDPVFIESPEGNLFNIRDTFKSSVNVRVVYLKVLPPNFAVKKGKKGKKPKKDKKKGKSKGKDKGKDKGKSKDKEEEPIPIEEPKEVIQKEITLCRFACDLKSVNWSDESIDFYWADDKVFGNNALQVEGCLKDINYGEGKVPKKEKKNKTTIASMGTEETNMNIKNPMPKIFTCQIGFGLLRSSSI